jgi:hypothetical protein
MLYDPKWEVPTAPVVSLEGLIAWLETQKPRRTYKFDCLNGTCLFSLYTVARGIKYSLFDATPEWHELHKRWASVASKHPWTFGAALKRARALAC